MFEESSSPRPRDASTRTSPILHADERSPEDAPSSSARTRRPACPFCGKPESSATNLWRHKAACAKNPNPTCAFCGQHYRAAELERHASRCPYRAMPREEARETPAPRVDETNAERASPRPTRTNATAKTARHAPAVTVKPRAKHAAKEPETDPTWDPADDGGRGLRLPKEWEAHMRAHPSKAARRRALLATRPGKPPQAPVHLPLDPGLASLALNAQELTRGLLVPPVGKLAAPREPSPVVTLAPSNPQAGGLSRFAPALTEGLSKGLMRLHERGLIPQPHSLREDPWERFLETAEARLTPEQMDDLLDETGEWPALTKTIIGLTCQAPPEETSPEDKLAYGLLGAAVVVGAWAVWKFVFAPEQTPPAPTAAQEAPSAPKYRPPWDASRYPTAEAYFAAWGHLPSPPPGHQAEQTAPLLGLDRRTPAALSPQASDTQRTREERERQG